jgi:NAD(P)-dependent dehydrogenase (short-subunit alcohol dehydrogenase family)
MNRTLVDIVDTALDVTIAPGFSRIGYDARSRLRDWVPVERYDLHGRVAVVTGATSGIGLATARRLTAAGATVELVARDLDKAMRVVDELFAHAPFRVGVVIADMGDLDAVRAAADSIAARHRAIDVLIHNAGALDATYRRAPTGVEQTVASPVLGPHLLTSCLRARLAAAAPSRVLWVASGGMYTERLDVDGLDVRPDDYNGTKAYARAKRAQVTLAEEWARRVADDGIVVHAMHPGWADTPGVARSLPTFRRVLGPLLRSAEQGADTLVWLAADEGEAVNTTGGFWHDRRLRPIHKLPATRASDTAAERARLWDWCQARTAPWLGVSPSNPPA